MEKIVGVRLGRGEPVVFCFDGGQVVALHRGRRVRVVADGVERDGVVVIAPDSIVAAPPFESAPRVASVYAEDVEADEASAPPKVIFLTAADAVNARDLAAALRLAAAPLPEAPPRTRRDDEIPT